MIEILEPRATEKPSWLELPEEEKQRHTYWSCHGEDIRPPQRRIWKRSQKPSEPAQLWISIFHDKEDAEAYAATGTPYWKWDREPAVPVTLQECMDEARQGGHAGVKVNGYCDGEWAELKTYPAGVPLRGDE